MEVCLPTRPAESRRLLLCVPGKTRWIDLRDVDHAGCIDYDTFGTGCSAQRIPRSRVPQRILDKRCDFSGASVSDVNAADKLVFVAGPVTRLRVGAVEHVIFIDGDSAQPAELFPLGDEVSLLVEDLDPMVSSVGNEQPAL